MQDPHVVQQTVNDNCTLASKVSIRLSIVEYLSAEWFKANKVSRLLPIVIPSISVEEYSCLIHKRICSQGHQLYKHLNGIHIMCGCCLDNSSSLLFFSGRPCKAGRSVLEADPADMGPQGPQEAVYDWCSSIKSVTDKINHDNSVVNKQNRANFKAAQQSYAARLSWHLPNSLSTVVSPSTPQPIRPHSKAPVWANEFSSSHRLYTVGGAVFCERCGSVASLRRKNKLHEECEPPEDGLVAGPLARINALLRGSIKGTGLSRWPDGSVSKSILLPNRFVPPTLTRVKDGSSRVCPPVVSETRLAASGPPLVGFANQPFGTAMSSMLSASVSAPVESLSVPFFWLQSESSSSGSNLPPSG